MNFSCAWSKSERTSGKIKMGIISPFTFQFHLRRCTLSLARYGADEVESHALWLQQNSSFLIRPCSNFLFIFPFAFAEEYCICKSEMWNVKSSSGLLHLLECAWASIHWSMKAATFISSITSAQIHSFFCWCVGYAIFIIVRTCSWIILSHTFPSLLLLFNEHFQINLLNKLLLKKIGFVWPQWSYYGWYQMKWARFLIEKNVAWLCYKWKMGIFPN